MAEDIDDEMKKLLKKYLKEGTSFFISEKKARKMMSKMFTDEFPPFGHGPSPFSKGIGMFDKDEMKRWKKENR
jgi:hypothetical protein